MVKLPSVYQSVVRKRLGTTEIIHGMVDTDADLTRTLTDTTGYKLSVETKIVLNFKRFADLLLYVWRFQFRVNICAFLLIIIVKTILQH